LKNNWGVELNGQDQDREIWRKILKLPFDPYVEEVKDERGNYLALRSSAFDGLTTGSEVHGAARQLFATLNVVMSQNVDADPVSAGAVVEFVADGTPRRQHFLEAEPIVLRLRFGLAELTLKDGHGNVIPPPVRPTVAQEWMRAAALEPEIGNALRYLAGNPGWVELYKAYEAIKGLVNGGISKNEIERFKQTANVSNRHHPNDTWKPHKRPMQLWEGRALITGWISAAIADVLARNP
jgi:hypothetical protein